MEILILGFILFIIGVGATIIYDKYGDRLKDLSKIKESFGKKEVIMQKQFDDLRAQVNKTTPKKKSQEEVLSELLRERNQTPKRVIKPGPFSAGIIKEGDIPTETIYDRELFDAVSINSKITVQQLIAKIESLKNRPGPKR